MKKRKAKKFPVLFLTGGGLLLIVAAVMLGLQNGSIQATPSESAVSSGHEEETYPEIERVSLDETKAAMDAGTAVIVDVRSVEAYLGSHIAGAVNIPLGELGTRLGELDKTQWIITYCT